MKKNVMFENSDISVKIYGGSEDLDAFLSSAKEMVVSKTWTYSYPQKSTASSNQVAEKSSKKEEKGVSDKKKKTEKGKENPKEKAKEKPKTRITPTSTSIYEDDYMMEDFPYYNRYEYYYGG